MEPTVSIGGQMAIFTSAAPSTIALSVTTVRRGHLPTCQQTGRVFTASTASPAYMRNGFSRSFGAASNFPWPGVRAGFRPHASLVPVVIGIPPVRTSVV